MNEALCLKNGWLGVSAANAQRSPSGGLPAFDPRHLTGPSHPSGAAPVKSARLLLCAGLLLLAGCGASPMARMRYGQSAGVAGDNIQGTSLLASMFRDAGYRMTTARTLGRTVNRANVVVWFPDRFSPPNKTTCEFFEQWLIDMPGRTLVYVGRDYHADVAYWRRINDEAAAARDAAQTELYDLRRWYARSRAEEQERDSNRRDSDSCKWFQIARDILPRDANELTGPWAETAAQAKYPAVVTAHWTLQGIQAEHAETLLASGDELLITRVSRPHWSQSQLLLVSNGSMFLNLPLVEPAHQAAGGETNSAVRTAWTRGVSHQRVDGAAHRERSPIALLITCLHHAAAQVYPHASFGGRHDLLFCRLSDIWSSAKLRQASRTDFGRHVMALGRLLAAAADTEHAYVARREYLHKVHGTPLAELPPAAAAEAGNPFRAEDAAELAEHNLSRATE